MAQGDSSSTPVGIERKRAILHVEAGPTFGGSTLALQNYLMHADPSRFAHDVLFYSAVPGIDRIRADSRRFLCLQRPAPPEWDRAPVEPATAPTGRPSLRRMVRRVPGVRWLARQVRGTHRFVRQEIPLALRIARILRQGRYELVHCNNTFVVQRGTLLAARLTRTPAVAHARTRVEIGRFDRYLANTTRRILSVSASLADDLSRQGVRAPLVVCYEGTQIGDPAKTPSVASDAQAGDARGQSRAGGHVLGFAGRLVERKGMRFLLEAMPHVMERHPDVRLEVVGDGPLRGELEALCAQYKVNQAVDFLGFRGDVPAWLKTIDVFVLPSLTEGLPLVLLEAMAAERPIVACGVDGVPEFIRNEETGLLTLPASAAALADALNHILSDSDLAVRLGRKARAFVEANGDLRFTSRLLDAALCEAARGSPPQHSGS